MRAPRPPTPTPIIVTIVNKLGSRIYKKEVKNTKLALWAELPLPALYITFIVYYRARRRRLCAPSWLCRCLGWCAHEKCPCGDLIPRVPISMVSCQLTSSPGLRLSSLRWRSRASSGRSTLVARIQPPPSKAVQGVQQDLKSLLLWQMGTNLLVVRG